MEAKPSSFRSTSIATWLLSSSHNLDSSTAPDSTSTWNHWFATAQAPTWFEEAFRHSGLMRSSEIGTIIFRPSSEPTGKHPHLKWAPRNVGKQMDCARCVTVPNHRKAAKANSCLFASHLSLNNGHTVICHFSPALARRARSICASARLRELRSPRVIYIRRWNKSRRHLEILIAGEERQQHDSMQAKINLCSSVM